MLAVDHTLTIRRIRDYYNEVVDVLAQLEDEELTRDESEQALMELDEKYTDIISKIYLQHHS